MGSCVKNYEIYLRGHDINYRRQPSSTSRMSNLVIERNRLAHPDTMFSSAFDSLDLYAYADAEHGRDIDSKR